LRTATWAFLAILMTGCVGMGAVVPQGALLPPPDLPAVRPATDFYNVSGEPTSTRYAGLAPGAQPFHALEEVAAHVEAWNATHPGLVEVRTLGASREGRPLWEVVVTNEARPGPKPALLIDGGHHGNENAGVEMALYLVDFLLENQARNATVAGWLDEVEVHTVPLVNPDGYVAQSRGNALGVNLNRNYDIDWGNQLGASNGVMGSVAHATNRSMPSVIVVAENCGPGPFSEPETQAMRDLMAALGPRLVGYLTYHTPTNALAAPWSAFDPPFPLPPEHDAFFEHVLQWTRDNTEYRAGKAQWANFSAGLPYAASGSSQDYAYANYEVPAFTLEIEIWFTSVTSKGYAERTYLEPYQGLAYWMEASLPIPLYLLANWKNLDAWALPEISPPLPEGVPPPPLSDGEKEMLVSPEHEGAPEDPGRRFSLLRLSHGSR
jgi:hypothetical protein